MHKTNQTAGMPMPLGQKQAIWVGSDASFHAAQSIQARLENMSATEILKAREEYESASEDADNPLLQTIGNVGVLSISGPLLAQGSWLSRMFGYTDYELVEEALVSAARDPEIGAIMLAMATPGGDVDGLVAVADMIPRVDRIKPTIAYAKGSMASAGLWLGAGAREIYSGKLSTVGSLGVIAMQVEVTEADKEAGEKWTIVRSGEYKQLGNPHEVFSDTGKAELQSMVNYTARHFLEHVAKARGDSPEAADTKYGQGRVFQGQQAVDVGLVDGVKTTEEVLAYVQALAAKQISRRKDPRFQSATGTQNNMAINEKTILALVEEGSALAASGVALEDMPEAVQKALADADTAAQEAEAQAAAEAEALKASGEESTDTETDEAQAAAEAEVAAAAAEAATNASSGDASVLAYVQGELKAKTDEVANLKVQLAKAEDKAEANNETMEGFEALVRMSARNHLIGLGDSADHLAELKGSALFAEADATRQRFEAKLKVGRTSMVPKGSPANTEQSQASTHYGKAALDAVRARTA